MMALIFSPLGLAALSTPAPSASPSPDGAPEQPTIRDIAPPLDVFPYPTWMVVAAAVLALIVLGVLVWLLIRWLRSRPAPPPPSPVSVALRDLELLRAKAGEMDPYAFSFAVSDVLRVFIGNARFKLPATRQTSPEFLAAIYSSPLFSENDRTLLAQFLEKCDMIKFARVNATSSDNVELVESALSFVRGGQS